MPVRRDIASPALVVVVAGILAVVCDRAPGLMLTQSRPDRNTFYQGGRTGIDRGSKKSQKIQDSSSISTTAQQARPMLTTAELPSEPRLRPGLGPAGAGCLEHEYHGTSTTNLTNLTNRNY